MSRVYVDSIAMQNMRGNKRLTIKLEEINMKATYEVISSGSKGIMKSGTTGIPNSQSGNIYVSREIFGHKLNSVISDAQTSTSSPQVLNWES